MNYAAGSPFYARWYGAFVSQIWSAVMLGLKDVRKDLA